MNHKHVNALLLSLASAVTGFAQQVTLNTTPSRTVGHLVAEGLSVTNCYANVCSPNLLEGREFWIPGGVALDTSASPPILYVSDTGNNRILAWKNATGFANGAPADLIIGQPNAYTSTIGGPGTTFSAGFFGPTGLAVRNGDLYVVDSGNNRVLRFPKPFSSPQLVPNMVLGQQSLSTRLANYPAGKPSANSVFFYSGQGSPFTANIAFDANGNLWLTDPGNRRVLRFPANAISANPANFPAADFLLGQTAGDFTDLLPNLSLDSTGAYSTSQFYVPAGIGFDNAGRLYVTDSSSDAPNFTINRVVVFSFGTPLLGFPQISATKIMGLPSKTASQPSQTVLNQTLFFDPSGVFFLPDPVAGQDVGVVDTVSSRLLIFPPYEQWSDPLVAPPATQVVGHNGDFSNRNPNNAALSTISPPPSATTLSLPGAAVFLNGELYVVDTGNNRVIVMPYSGGNVGAATSALGQPRLNTGSPNYIDGREFQFSTGDAGVAVDNSSTTPHLYIADTSNHRVLGFKDLRTVNANSRADIVLGQPDLQTAICNYSASSATKGGDPGSPNQASLCGPVGLTVDAKGNLYVADSLNGRVLRFPAPFSYTGAAPEPADLVLGQQDFTSQFTDPSQFNLARPYGVALTPAQSGPSLQPLTGVAVSDIKHNRVLYFPAINGSFSNGEAASKVFGQGLFNSISAGNDQASLNQPHGISSDTSGRVYIADTGNNRIQIFPDPNNPGTPIRGGAAVFSIVDNPGGLNSPHAVFVSAITGEIWVADSNNGQAKRYGRFPDQLQVNAGSTAQIPAAAAPLAVAQDQFGDLILADYSSRVAFYFPGLQAVNGGSFLLTRALAPGMVASICAPGSNANTPSACLTGDTAFGAGTATASGTPPLQTTLGDTQVLFNGKPAPLWYVSASQINFVVPNGQNPGDIPTTGYADLQVIRPSTGQVLAAGSVPMNPASPGILQQQYTGTLRQAAVLNQDNTPNTPTNPAPRGSVIQIFATGAGFIPGAPADGVAPQSPLSTPNVPDVIIGACRVDDTACTGDPAGTENVSYSGLDSYPGVWQINVKIPQNTAPGTQVPLFVGMDSIYSSDPNSGFRMVIAVK